MNRDASLPATGPPSSSASVATARADRYAKQLVAHLGHRGVPDWDPDTGCGNVDFGDMGRVTLATDENALHLTVGGEDLDRLEGAVGRHLVRFGTKDELRVSWVRSDGSAGTEQRQTAAEPPVNPTGPHAEPPTGPTAGLG